MISNKLKATLLGITLLVSPVIVYSAQETILSGAGIFWGDEKDKINLNFSELYGWGDHGLVGYLTTETDPVFTAWDKDYNDLINKPDIPGSLTEGAGIDITGSTISIDPVTAPTLNQNTTGTAANVTGTVAVANGGTGSTTASGARTNLGLAIGTNVQAYDEDLTTYAMIPPSANVQSVLGAASYAAIKTLLDIDDLQTATGIAAGTAHLGTFTGTTITDSSTIKTALQELETAVEGAVGGTLGAAAYLDATNGTIGDVVVWADDGAGNASLPISVSAGDVSIADVGEKYTSTNVDGALTEVMDAIPADVGDLTDTGGLLTSDTLADLSCTANQIAKWNGSAWVCAADATAAGAGYTSTVPTYSDEACTAGQYAFSTTTGYVCVASGDWNTFALTNWSNPTPTAPTLSSAALGTDGETLTLVFSEAVTRGTGFSIADLDINASVTGNNLAFTLSGATGDTTDTHTYALSTSTVNADETVTLDWAGTVDGLSGATGDLAAITAGAVTNNSTQGVAACADSSSTGFLVYQNFEGTGYDNSETWTESGSDINPDYTTVALRGTQSLFMDDVNGSQVYVSAGSDYSPIYGFFRFRGLTAASAGNTPTLFEIRTAGGATVGSIRYVESSDSLRIYHGTQYDDVALPFYDTSTTYYIWYDYTVATGAGNDGVANLYVSTSRTKPASAGAAVSTGTSTTGFGRIYFKTNGTAYEFVVDQVLLSDSNIGDVCE